MDVYYLTMLTVIEKYMSILVTLNGGLDILNVFLHTIFGLSWYNFVISDPSADFLYFVFLYGSIRVYEGIQNKYYFLSMLTYILEVVYFFNISITTSMICLVISLILLNYQFYFL